MAGIGTIRVTGIAEAERKLGQQLIARPVRNFFNRSTITIQSASRPLAPVDRGRLKNDIGTEIDAAFVPRWARVGTNVHYSPYQELGTKPFWPPKAPLEAWGRRKGLTPQQVYLVRRAISRHGIKPKKFLTTGTERSMPAIRGYDAAMGVEIEAEAATA